MEWILLIISTFAYLLAFAFLPETYFPVLLDWKAKALREVSGDERYVSQHADEKTGFLKRLKKNLPLGIRFITTEPVILALGSFRYSNSAHTI
jgi:hypothetical protein